METKKSEIVAFDITKTILAVLVVAIHTMPLSSYSRIANAVLVNMICRVAVPIFFLISGYLIRVRIDTPEKETGMYFYRYIKRTLKIYLSWSVIYFIVDGIFYREQYGSVFDCVSTHLYKCLTGGYGHLWYLYSTIIAVLVLYLVHTKLKNIEKYAIYIAVAFYIFGAIINDIYTFIDCSAFLLVWEFVRYPLFIGTPFLMIGFYNDYWMNTNMSKIAGRGGCFTSYLSCFSVYRVVSSAAF